MESHSTSTPRPDFRQEGMGHILVVMETLSDLDGQRAAQDSAHASHNLPYGSGFLQQ